MFILQIGGFIIKQENKRHFTDILSSGLEILAVINVPSLSINLWNSAKPMANRQEIGMVHLQWLISSGKATSMKQLPIKHIIPVKRLKISCQRHKIGSLVHDKLYENVLISTCSFH